MLKHKRTKIAALSASILASWPLSQANAQTAPSETPKTDAPPEGEAQEIVVTAQKRKERLVDVPISITVIGGEQLDHSSASGATEILRTVPGVATVVHYQGGGTQVSVRGVAANGAIFRGSSPISYYLDYAPFGFVKTANAPDSNVYDLERIEVLRGPQGTLYGASAQNGVVRILTKDADLDEFEGKARGSVSTTRHGTQNFRGDAAINVPIVEDKLAVRIVGGYEKFGGWIDKPNDRNANDAEIINTRVKINLAASERLSVGLSAWLYRSDYGAPSNSGDGRNTPTVQDEPIKTDYDVFSARLAYDLSGATLSNVTSYLSYRNASILDNRPLGINANLFTGLDSDVFTNELLLTSDDAGPWRWSVGAIYRNGQDRLRQVLPGVLPAPIDFTDKSESYAIFGQVTRLLLDDKLELSVGARYFKDKVLSRENSRHTGIVTEPLYRASVSFEKSSPRVGITWHPMPDLTFYASYAEGFRSGFPQNANIVRAAPQFPALRPDNLKNYELGSKGRLWNGLLSYDAALYYIDWQDVQMTLSVPINGGFFSAPVNGTSASGPGAEVSLALKPVRDLEIGGNVGWNDLTSDTDVLSSNVVLLKEGDRLNYSPKWTAGAYATYSFPIGSGGLEGSLSGSVNYSSRQDFHNIQRGQSVNYPGDPVTIARADFSLRSTKRWAITLFADNLTDSNDRPIGGLFGAPAFTPRIRPRTIGLQFETQF